MQNKTILIVDDDEISRRELKDGLKHLKLATDVAAAAQETLDKIEATPFDLVLLEIGLSGKDGWHVLRRLRHIHPHLPVVLMTTNPTVEDIVDGMRHGAVDFLEKPFQPKHVQQVVSQALERRSAKEAPSNEYHALLELSKKCLNQSGYDDAVEHIKSAIALAPGRPEAFNLLGAVHENQGDRENAAKYYRAACGLDFAYKPATHNLKRLSFNPRLSPEKIELDS